MKLLKHAAAFATVLVSAVSAFAQTTHFAYSDADALAEAARSGLECNDNSQRTVETITHTYKFSYEGPADAAHEMKYFIVSCPFGAYNEASMLLTPDPYANVLRPVPLATPIANGKKILGWEASLTTGYLSYDAAKHTLTSFFKGRGVGDMSDSGTYELYEGRVVLRKYEVDQTGNSKVNPVVVFKSVTR